MKVIKQLMHWMSKGIRIYYIIDNDDETLRKFAGFKMGSLKIVNKWCVSTLKRKKDR